MSGPQAPDLGPELTGTEQMPPVEVLLADTVARLSLAAHAYMTDEQGNQADLASAEISIDIASTAFDRIKDRLRPEERLAITQLLTETRMTFVRKRGF
jgi:hypothetical protein